MDEMTINHIVSIAHGSYTALHIFGMMIIHGNPCEFSQYSMMEWEDSQGSLNQARPIDRFMFLPLPCPIIGIFPSACLILWDLASNSWGFHSQKCGFHHERLRLKHVHPHLPWVCPSKTWDYTRKVIGGIQTNHNGDEMGHFKWNRTNNMRWVCPKWVGWTLNL